MAFGGAHVVSTASVVSSWPVVAFMSGHQIIHLSYGRNVPDVVVLLLLCYLCVVVVVDRIG